MVDQAVSQFDDAYYTGMYGGHRWKSKLHAMIKDQEVYTRGPNTINSNEPEEPESAEKKVRERVEQRNKIKESYGYGSSSQSRRQPSYREGLDEKGPHVLLRQTITPEKQRFLRN